MSAHNPKPSSSGDFLTLEHFEYGKFLDEGARALVDWRATAYSSGLSPSSCHRIFRASYIGDLTGDSTFPGQVGFFRVTEKVFVLACQRVTKQSTGVSMHQGYYIILPRRDLMALDGLIWPLVEHLELLSKDIPVRKSFCELGQLVIPRPDLPRLPMPGQEIGFDGNRAVILARLLNSDEKLFLTGLPIEQGVRLLYLDGIRALIPLEYRLRFTFTTSVVDFRECSAHVQVLDPPHGRELNPHRFLGAGQILDLSREHSLAGSQDYVEWVFGAETSDPQHLRGVLREVRSVWNIGASIRQRLDIFAEKRREWEQLLETCGRGESEGGDILDSLNTLCPYLTESEFERLIEIAANQLPLSLANFQAISRTVRSASSFPESMRLSLQFSSLGDTIKRCIQEGCEETSLEIVDAILHNGEAYDLRLLDEAIETFAQYARLAILFRALLEIAEYYDLEGLEPFLHRHRDKIAACWPELPATIRALFGEAKIDTNISQLTSRHLLLSTDPSVLNAWHRLVIGKALEVRRPHLLDATSFCLFARYALWRRQDRKCARELLTKIQDTINDVGVDMFAHGVLRLTFLTICYMKFVDLTDLAAILLKGLLPKCSRQGQVRLLVDYYVTAVQAARGGYPVKLLRNGKDFWVSRTMYENAVLRAAERLQELKLVPNVEAGKRRIRALERRAAVQSILESVLPASWRRSGDTNEQLRY